MTRRTAPKAAAIALIGLSLLFLLAYADTCIGPIEMDGSDLSRTVLWKLRIPRICVAVLAGASLALAGAQMQGVFRNPLADPHIMGVSAGAGLGAAIATLSVGSGARTIGAGILGAGLRSGVAGGLLGSVTDGLGMAFSLAGAAFLGAVLTSALIIAVASKIRSGTTLLIFGVMTGFILSAVTSILEYSSSEESLKLFYSWSAGSFVTSSPTSIVILAVALTVGAAIAIAGSKGLDLSLFGDEYVRLNGGNAGRIRTSAMISCCLLTGAATAFCGPLGFVGIIAPHITRTLTGTSRHIVVLPLCTVIGAVLSLVADILSQLAPTPLPVGSTLALIGIPVIIYMLLRK